MVAVARNNVIGANGEMPWHLSSDLKMFRRITMGKPIIMGRRTWESLKKRPLDGRDNIVVTRDKRYEAEGAIVVQSLAEALTEGHARAQERGAEEIIIIGGAEIYKSSLPLAHRLYWTTVDAEPDGDTYFPDFDKSDWRQVHTEPVKTTDKDQFQATFHIFERD